MFSSYVTLPEGTFQGSQNQININRNIGPWHGDLHAKCLILGHATTSGLTKAFFTLQGEPDAHKKWWVDQLANKQLHIKSRLTIDSLILRCNPQVFTVVYGVLSFKVKLSRTKCQKSRSFKTWPLILCTLYVYYIHVYIYIERERPIDPIFRG